MARKFLFITLASLITSAATAADLSQDLALLKELVMISSKTEDLNGVNQVQDRMAAELAKLGFQIQFVNNPSAESGKQLVATLAGKSQKYITLLAHADTVFKTLIPFALSTDGKTAKGSGIGDNKGGFVVGLKAVKALIALGKPALSLRFVVSPSEETGSNGFQELLMGYSLDSVAVFSLEPTMPDGSFVTKRKGLRWYDINVQGKAAHSGVALADGINACFDLSKKLVMAQELTDLKAGRTVSIGKFGGGAAAANTVCPLATATLDTRFWTVEEGNSLAASIESILAQSFARSESSGEVTKTSFTIINSTPPFSPTSDTIAPFVQAYKKSVLALEGREAQEISSGGGADISFMSRPGLIALDGLGPVTRNTHVDSEELDVSSLHTRAQALTELLIFVGRSL